jgi:hypothetical protein
MSLYTEIYNFFNEARPSGTRTVNKDVEDIVKGRYVMKGEDPKDINNIDRPRRAQRTAPAKQVVAQLPADKEGRSSFEKGKVHEIIFKNKFRGQPRKFFTLYRKISEEEYKKLDREFDLNPKIFPSDKEEHFEDIYYLTPEMGISIEKEGFFPLSKKQLKDVQDNYPEYATDLKPVSMEDVLKGVNLRYYSIDEIKKQWDIKKAYREKRKEKGDEKVQKDIEKDQKVKDEIGSFLANNDSIIANMISSFNKMRAIGAKKDAIEEYKEFLDKLADRFVERIKKEKIPVQNGIFQRLGEKLKDKPQVFNIIKDKYAGKDTAVTPDTKVEPETKKDKVEPTTQKDKQDPSAKAKPKKGDNLSAESIAKKYMLDGTHQFTINNFIKTYAASEERDETGRYVNDKEEREYQRNKMFDFIPKIIEQIFKYSESNDVRDEILNSIKDRVVAIVGKGAESEELNNILSKAYDNMKKKQVKEGNITEASKKYLVKTKPGSQADSIYTKNQKDKNVDDNGKPIPGEYLVTLDDEQLPKLRSADMKSKGIMSIDLYDSEVANEKKPLLPQDMTYKVSAKVGSGSEQEGRMLGTKIVSMLKADPKYSKITFDDLKEKEPYNLKGKEGQDIVLTIKSLTPFGQSGKRTVFGTKDTKEDEPETRKVSVRIPYQTPQTVSYAVNKGVKMAKQNTSGLSLKFYVVNTEKKEIVKGFDNWGEAKKAAQSMGPKFKAMQRAEITSAGINEALSKEDIAKLKSTRVSFTIQSDLDPDKQYNISDNVREVKEEKGKVVLTLAEAGVVTFDKEGTGIFKYSKDNKEYQALNVPADINSIVKKALAPKEDKKEPESQLEAYIRKRIRQAIKEAEVSQYWGYQGKDVKKKRLEEYLKRYDWGFQDSDNPYTHSNGSAKHAIVSKLVHELQAMGVDAIAIFNSYAPKEYQVSDIDQLDYASDSPLGSQLTQPYNPDSLTARGGRVAEQGPVPYKGQGADQLDRLVKDMSPKLKDAVKAKADSKQAKELISVFRQVYKMADDVTDDMIYNKIKSV